MGKPPWGHTQGSWTESIGSGSETQGIETSKYLQEQKSNEIPRVAASEKGTGQIRCDSWRRLRDLNVVCEAVGEAAGKPHQRR